MSVLETSVFSFASMNSTGSKLQPNSKLLIQQTASRNEVPRDCVCTTKLVEMTTDKNIRTNLKKALKALL